MIEQIFELVGVELFIAQKIEDDAGVEVARARPHRNAASGSEAHRSVDRYPVSQCTQTRSVAQMSEDGSLGKLCAEMMHQRLVRNTVETITANPCVEVALREGEMRCDFRHRLMKSVVEAGKLRGRRKDRLRGGDERQSLRNMQWSKVGCGAELVQNLWRDDLVSAKIGSAVHDAVADSHRHAVDMFPYRRGESGQRIALRFVNTLALQKRSSVGGTNVQGSIVLVRCRRRFRSAAASSSVAPRSIDAELQRRRAAVEYENEAVFFGSSSFAIPIPATSSFEFLLYRCLRRERS